jgi:HK97 family phage major capsid protein
LNNEKQLNEERYDLLDKMENMLDTATSEKRAFQSKELRQIESIKERINEIDRELQLESRGEMKMVKDIATNEVLEKEVRQFLELVRTGENRDLASANNGSVIPKLVASKIVEKVLEISPLIAEATRYEVSSDLNLPIYDYTAHTTAFIQEFTAITESGGTFTHVALTNHIVGTLTKIGKSLIHRGDIDVLGFIISACAKSVAKFVENEIILDTNNKFASTLKDGVTQSYQTATTLVIAPEELVKLKNKIPSAMLPNAKWLMHKDTLAYLHGLKTTTGEFVFGNDLSQASGNMILGHEVMLSDAMPVNAVGARIIYFGDFKEGLAIKIGAQSADIYKELYAKEYAIGVGHFMELDASASHNVQALAVMIGK